MLLEWPREKQELYLDALLLAGRVFWGPDLEFVQEIREDRTGEDLARLAGLLEGAAGEAALGLGRSLGEFDSAQEAFVEWEAEYVSLFVNAPGGVAVPLYQSVHDSEEGLVMGPAAQRMAARLETAGLSANLPQGQPADHLAVELEYLFLVLEEAVSEEDRVALDEAAAFAREELVPWLERVTARLAQAAPDGLYTRAAALALGLARVAARQIART